MGRRVFVGARWWRPVLLLLLAASMLVGCPRRPGNGVDSGAPDGGGNVTDSGNGTDSGSGAVICEGVPTVPGQPILTTEIVATGLSQPVHIAASPGDTARVFIVEQPGRIRVVLNGTLLPTSFLDIQSSVSFGAERGLLSVAFHPDYASNGFLFVNYTASGAGATTVSRFSVSGDPNVADLASETVLLTVTQIQGNHNGGQIAFGPDGFLYIGMGDGGGAGDPENTGQDDTRLLGALLRIDVDSGLPYSIPSDNPFAGNPLAVSGDCAATPCPEIFSSGMRNPWRFSFDRVAGDLYIGDVGQNAQEEIDVAPFPGLGNGANYGWDLCEGTLGNCAGFDPPLLTYPNPAAGCSVTGGHVYRGCRMPDMRGTYFYADYCDSWVRTFRYVGGAATDTRDVTGELGLSGAFFEISSFGEDAYGEIYIAMHSSGDVLRIVPVP